MNPTVQGGSGRGAIEGKARSVWAGARREEKKKRRQSHTKEGRNSTKRGHRTYVFEERGSDLDFLRPMNFWAKKKTN